MVNIQKIKRHQKLWEKFFANWKNLFSSPQRFVIKIFKGLWFLVEWPFELLGDFIFISKKKIKIQPKRILIIKVDQLGDVLFSTLLIGEIKKLFPEVKIDYLINKKSEEILKGNPLLNQVFFWENILLALIPGRKGNFGFGKLKENHKTWKILRSNNYDLVINARGFWPSSNLLWRFLSKNLIAFDFSQFSFLAAATVGYNLREDEWKNYLRLLSPLEDDFALSDIQPSQEFFNCSEFQVPVSPYFCLAPVSFDSEKTWTIKKWQEFIQEFIINFHEYKLVLLGLPNQLSWLNNLVTDHKDRIIIYTDLKISDLGKVIKEAHGFFGLESFSVHLAIALKKKVFCLVNSKLFYVSGLSTQCLVDGKSMLASSDNVNIFDLKAEPSKIVEEIKIICL